MNQSSLEFYSKYKICTEMVQKSVDFLFVLIKCHISVVKLYNAVITLSNGSELDKLSQFQIKAIRESKSPIYLSGQCWNNCINLHICSNICTAKSDKEILAFSIAETVTKRGLFKSWQWNQSLLQTLWTQIVLPLNSWDMDNPGGLCQIMTLRKKGSIYINIISQVWH